MSKINTLTIHEALQKGITAHKEGKLQDAERLYRSILNAQPEHPDANHNLGLLAMSANKASLALPFFKAAIKANPRDEQFWLSYISALIKERQSDVAKQVIEQAKKQGVRENRLTALVAKLEKPETMGQHANNPPQQQLGALLAHYQNGRFGEAQALATSITEEFPRHPWSWKVLGLVFNQLGRFSESLSATETFLRLAPKDAEGHSNLGATLKELGRLEEAVASYKEAIALKSDLAGAHYNLGITLRELGRLSEAEASYIQAIALNPNISGVYSNLGITLQEQGRLHEAEESYRKAIALEPNKADAHYNLGSTLQEQGRLEAAITSYEQAIALKPDYSEAHENLGTVLLRSGRYREGIIERKKGCGAISFDLEKGVSIL